MTKSEIIAHNENLARKNAAIAYQRGDLHRAMKLCQEYTGVTSKEAYEKVKEWCEGLEVQK